MLRTGHSYDPINGDRLTTTDPREHTTTFGYDAHGNLASTTTDVTDHAGAATRSRHRHDWDILGRPISRTDPEDHITDFTHDTLGRLITRPIPRSRSISASSGGRSKRWSTTMPPTP